MDSALRAGEWTDDTAQALAIAAVAATGADLRDSQALDAIAANFAAWYAGNPPDVGIQTGRVLRIAGPDATAAAMTAAARAVHDRTGRSAGNGSLMRTAPVALAHLDDPTALVEAAMAVSALTHHQDIACEAAALWCLMIRHTVLTGDLPDLDTWDGFKELGARASSGTDWRAVLAEAEARPASHFRVNVWAVGALQAAWSAIVQTPYPVTSRAGTSRPPWPPRSASVKTPTPWARSPARCSAPGGAPARSRNSGRPSSTGGARTVTPTGQTWCGWHS